MNVVEIIIKAVDKYSKELKKAEEGLKQVSRVMNAVAKVGAAVAGGFVLAYNAIKNFRDEAERIGRTDVAANIDKMTTAVENLQAVFLTLKGPGGKSLSDWLNEAAIGFTNVSNAIAAAKIKERMDEIYRQLDQGQKKQGQGFAGPVFVDVKLSEQERKALEEEVKVLEDMTKALAANIPVVADNVSGLRALGNMNKRVGASLDELIRKNKALNNEYDKRKSIEDAIRAGDARALANAMYGGGSGGRDFNNLRPGSGPKANGGGGGGGGNMGGKGDVNVTVVLGDKPVKGIVKEVIRDDWFKPALKNKGSGPKRKK